MDAEASMIHATCCFFTKPKASEFSRFLVDYNLGDCGLFSFFGVGGDVFLLEKMGCVGDVPLESWHSGDGRNHTPSHSPVKKRMEPQNHQLKRTFLGFQLLIFRSVGTLLSSSSCYTPGLLRSAGSGLNFYL